MTSIASYERPQFRQELFDEPSPYELADARAWERYNQFWMRSLLLGMVVSTTLLQKFALPVLGDTPLSVGLILLGILTAAGLLVGQLRLDGTNVTCYLLVAAALMATQIINGTDFSKSSLALLLAIHVPYLFRFRYPLTDATAPLRIYQDVMLLVAVCGIAQFALQFVIGWQSAFLLDTAVPEAFLDPGYHELNPIAAGHLYKANGFFMLEASLLSQTAAIAILIEFLQFRRTLRLLIYAGAMAVAYSGTGLILLGLLIPPILIRNGRYGELLLIAAGLLIAIVFADELQLTDLIDRMGEFSNIRSSGFARFVSIFYLISDFQLDDLPKLIWGTGAGSITHMNSLTYYQVHDPSWGKIVFEYGLVGAAVYFPSFIRMLRSEQPTPYLRPALLIQYLFLGGYLLTPVVHALFLALLVWPSQYAEPLEEEPLEEPLEDDPSVPMRREPTFGPRGLIMRRPRDPRRDAIS